MDNERGPMDSKQCIELILEAKGERALTFADIAAKVGRSEVWTTSAIFGQAPAATSSSCAGSMWRTACHPSRR